MAFMLKVKLSGHDPAEPRYTFSIFGPAGNEVWKSAGIVANATAFRTANVEAHVFMDTVVRSVPVATKAEAIARQLDTGEYEYRFKSLFGYRHDPKHVNMKVLAMRLDAAKENAASSDADKMLDRATDRYKTFRKKCEDEGMPVHLLDDTSHDYDDLVQLHEVWKSTKGGT